MFWVKILKAITRTLHSDPISGGSIEHSGLSSTTKRQSSLGSGRKQPGVEASILKLPATNSSPSSISYFFFCPGCSLLS